MLQADRELLEGAAEAAELTAKLEWRDGGFVWVGGNVFAVRTWNPLVDDGDALRLAVRLGICIEFGYCLDDAPIVRCGPLHEQHLWEQTPNFPDSNAATRRAIVCAAAAMARARRRELAEFEALALPTGKGSESSANNTWGTGPACPA